MRGQESLRHDKNIGQIHLVCAFDVVGQKFLKVYLPIAPTIPRPLVSEILPLDRIPLSKIVKAFGGSPRHSNIVGSYATTNDDCVLRCRSVLSQRRYGPIAAVSVYNMILLCNFTRDIRGKDCRSRSSVVRVVQSSLSVPSFVLRLKNGRA